LNTVSFAEAFAARADASSEGQMQHGILGAGGVGGLVGALLARAGERVTLIVRPEAVEHYPHELLLSSRRLGTVSVAVSVTSELSHPVDVLWITVKATDLHTALESIHGTNRIGAVVPLLNGIDHVTVLRERFGHDKVVPATIAVETERIAPGQIAWRSPFATLKLSSRGRKLLTTTIEELAHFGFECHFIDDEDTLLWSKLVFLAPFALSTTAANAPIGQVISDPRRRVELRELVMEACAVATKSGGSCRSRTGFSDLFHKLTLSSAQSVDPTVPLTTLRSICMTRP
jgi:2-dehydropantoate 2-reductase